MCYMSKPVILWAQVGLSCSLPGATRVATALELSRQGVSYRPQRAQSMELKAAVTTRVRPACPQFVQEAFTAIPVCFKLRFL